MSDVNERLIKAAKSGSAVEVKALLQDPKCRPLVGDSLGRTALMWAAQAGDQECVAFLLQTSNPLDADFHGMTALMWAAQGGSEACVKLLLPVSNALAKDKEKRTASFWARISEDETLSQFIDAYALAQSERATIDEALGGGAHLGRASPRM